MERERNCIECINKQVKDILFGWVPVGVTACKKGEDVMKNEPCQEYETKQKEILVKDLNK